MEKLKGYKYAFEYNGEDLRKAEISAKFIKEKEVSEKEETPKQFLIHLKAFNKENEENELVLSLNLSEEEFKRIPNTFVSIKDKVKYIDFYRPNVNNSPDIILGNENDLYSNPGNVWILKPNKNKYFFKISIPEENLFIWFYLDKSIIDYIHNQINKEMKYSFKFYYKDGTSEIAEMKSPDPEGLYYDFDGLMDWDELDEFWGKGLTTHEVLELAYDLYRNQKNIKDYYKIEIVNIYTGEVIDYIDEEIIINYDIEDYFKAQIKLNNFYNLYNSVDKRTGKKIKELFNYKKIKNNTFIFDKYTTVLYKELINIIYDCFKFQLQVIYKTLNRKEEKNIETIISNLPIEVKDVINKYLFDNTKLEDFINVKIETNTPILYYISSCCDYLMDILEMFYETKKYEIDRAKFLKTKDGKEEKQLLELIKKNKKI